jgi:hypothetical protein
MRVEKYELMSDLLLLVLSSFSIIFVHFLALLFPGTKFIYTSYVSGYRELK